ncbi:hypothetical protein D9M72_414800 [compost metagenome]
MPSAKPRGLLPASVVTSPVGVILRTTPPPYSRTYRLPAASTATEMGVLKVAAVPLPSVVVFVPLPATVVTSAAGVTLRIRWPWASATKAVSVASTVKLVRSLNEALRPLPSTDAKTPLPANVVTSASGEILRKRLFDQSPMSRPPFLVRAMP